MSDTLVSIISGVISYILFSFSPSWYNNNNNNINNNNNYNKNNSNNNNNLYLVSLQWTQELYNYLVLMEFELVLFKLLGCTLILLGTLSLIVLFISFSNFVLNNSLSNSQRPVHRRNEPGHRNNNRGRRILNRTFIARPADQFEK